MSSKILFAILDTAGGGVFHSVHTTLSAIKNFTLNLIPINRASKGLFTRIYRLLMAFKISWSRFSGYFNGIHP